MSVLPPVRGDALIRVTEGVDPPWDHGLGDRLQELVANPVERVYRREAEDPTSIRVVTTSTGASDLSAVIRHDGDPASLHDLIAAGDRGAALEYFPSAAIPLESYPCVLVGHGPIQPDRQTGRDSRYECAVRLRSSSSWTDLVEAP